MNREAKDLWFLVASRGTRSFAGGILSVIISLYYKSIYHSVAPIGFLFGAGALGVPILSFLTGRYADRYGRKKLLLLTLSFLPTAVIMLLLTNNYYVLLLSAALGGFGIAGGLVGGGVGASVAPMQSALLAEKTNSGNRTTIFSLFTIMSSITGSAGAVAANLGNFRLLFYISLILSAFSLFIALPITESFRPRKREAVKGAKRFTRRARTAAEAENMKTIDKFIVTGSLNGAAQGFIIPFLPIILQKNMGMSVGTIGDLFAAGGLVSAFFMFATPYLTNRLGFVKFIMSTRSLSSIFLLYFPFATSAIAASVTYVIFTTSRAISLPSQSSLMMNMVDEDTRAYASGTNQSARLLPSAAAASTSGEIQDFFNYVIPFEIAFVLNVLNVYLYYRFFGKVPMANRNVAAIHE